MLNSLKDSIAEIDFCKIMDCHDSTNTESRNDEVGRNMEYLKYA